MILHITPNPDGTGLGPEGDVDTALLCRSVSVLQALSDETALNADGTSDLDIQGIERSHASVASVYAHMQASLPVELSTELLRVLPLSTPDGVTPGEARAFLAAFTGWLSALYQTSSVLDQVASALSDPAILGTGQKERTDDTKRNGYL